MTLSDCTLPGEAKTVLESMVRCNDIQNMLFYSAPGTGKTSAARSLCKDMEIDYLYINGSNEGRLIDTLRTKIQQFASTISLMGKKTKCVIIDESDEMGEVVQKALRAFIEQFAISCRFIFIANYPEKICEPLKSRLMSVNFNPAPGERQQMAMTFFNRCVKILESEGVEYEKMYLVEFVKEYFPDFRKITQTIQRCYMSYGKINEGLSVFGREENSDEYIKLLKDRDYDKIAKWLAATQPEASLFRELMEKLPKIVTSDCAAVVIDKLGHFAWTHTSSIDPFVNFCAMSVNLMAVCKWK